MEKPWRHRHTSLPSPGPAQVSGGQCQALASGRARGQERWASHSHGMQEPQGILVVHVGPLLQQHIDVRKARPLPAGGAGKHQGQRAHLRVAIITLFPQALLVSISEPGDGGGRWERAQYYSKGMLHTPQCSGSPTLLHLSITWGTS